MSVLVPRLFKKPFVALVGDRCYKYLEDNENDLIHFLLHNISCRNLLFSKALGLGIVVGGSIVKVPQILKILTARSTEGLSFTACILEALCYVVALAYNIRTGTPFSTYGETLFIAIQTGVILALMVYYSRLQSGGKGLATIAAIFLLASYAQLGFVLTNPRWTEEAVLITFQSLTIPFSVFSRAPQIWENWRNGSTGQLSAITVGLFFAGAVARIYTTLQEIKDRLILTGFVVGAFLNGVLLFQMVYYWNAKVDNRKARRSSPPTLRQQQQQLNPKQARTPPTARARKRD